MSVSLGPPYGPMVNIGEPKPWVPITRARNPQSYPPNATQRNPYSRNVKKTRINQWGEFEEAAKQRRQHEHLRSEQEKGRGFDEGQDGDAKYLAIIANLEVKTGSN